jgi:signal transduction histidine kinase
LLEVRQAALWLPDDKGGYQVVEALRAENPLPIAQADLQHQLPAALVTRTGLDEGRLQSAAPVITPQFLLGQYPWIEVLLPLKIGSEVVGLLALGPRVPDGTYNAFQLDFVKKAGDLLAMAAHTTRLFDQVRAQSRAMMETRAAERRQVARELHDGPVQVATAIAFKAEVAADKFHDDDLTRMAKNARQLTQDLRAICTGLRPLEIDSGLASVIDSAVRRFQETQPDMFIENETEPELPAVGARVTEAIYHIATESLTNIGKYAKAEQVWVSLRRENGNLELQIADDGQGFPQAELSLSALARSGHFGLMGLHEWAAIAKGQLQFRPRDGGGTVLSLCVPIQAG